MMDSARPYMRARMPFSVDVLDRAKVVALASFRGLLSDFASLGIPRHWRDKAPTSPIITELTSGLQVS